MPSGALIELGSGLATMSEDERPSRVIAIMMTDGLENASKVFTAPQVLDLIVQQRDIYKWDFVYLGANQDAIATAAKMGIAAHPPCPTLQTVQRRPTLSMQHQLRFGVRERPGRM
jgi:hypothetical protein